MQLAVDPVMRGRVMALYMAVFMGGTPIGAPLVGAIAEAFGARWSLLAGGLVSATAARGRARSCSRRRSGIELPRRSCGRDVPAARRRRVRWWRAVAVSVPGCAR